MKNTVSRPMLAIFLLTVPFLLFCTTVTSLPLFPQKPSDDTVVYQIKSSDATGADTYIADINNANVVTTKKAQSEESIYIASTLDLGPSGRRLAFYYTVNDKKGIYVMDMDGNNIIKLTDYGTDPIWSPDGRWLLFENQAQDGSTNVNAVNVATREIFTCPEPLGDLAISVEWVSNTHNIIYTTGDIFSSQLYECDVENRSGQFVGTDGDTRMNVHFLSPDAQNLVYKVFDKPGSPDLEKIAKFTPDGIIDSKVFLKDGLGLQHLSSQL